MLRQYLLNLVNITAVNHVSFLQFPGWQRCTDFKTNQITGKYIALSL
jgi:hypothetical protein